MNKNTILGLIGIVLFIISQIIYFGYDLINSKNNTTEQFAIFLITAFSGCGLMFCWAIKPFKNTKVTEGSS